MRFESILIITYGRSGSTLLMGILNSIPGVLIRGENMKLCFGLFSAYQSLLTTKNVENKDAVTHPFYGFSELNEDRFLQDARHLLRRQLVPASEEIKCWGFKEIRYVPGLNVEYGLRQYLDFLARLMPKPCFIFLTRDHESVATSGFWRKFDKSKVLELLKTFENEARAWSETAQNCYWLDYSDMVNRTEKLVSLFDFIGAEYCAERVEEVMAKEHSYDNKIHLSATNGQLSQIRTEVFYHPHVIVAKVDSCPKSVAEWESISVGGIVVLAPEISTPLRLMVEGSEVEPEVRTRLPSPWYGQQFPDNPNAAHARFEIKGLKFSPKRPVTVFIVDESGQPSPVFQMEGS